MATVYLHAGLTKTGTTAIQFFLWDNCEALKKHGACYPDLGFRYPGKGIRRNAHFLVAVSDDKQFHTLSEWTEGDYQKGLDMISDLAREYDHIILSDEGIWRASQSHEAFWQTLKNDLRERDIDLKLIVYVRRQDLWIQSNWAQIIKKGYRHDFHRYLEFARRTDYPIDYYKRLEELSGILGKESIIVRVYERGQFLGEEHTIQSDFLDIFGISLKDGFKVKQSLYNTSLSGDYLEIQRRLNVFPDMNKEHILNKTIKAIQQQSGSDSRFSYFAPGEQAEFLESFARSNSLVAREYLGREDGILFHDPLEEAPTYTPDESELTVKMMYICGTALQQLDAQNQLLEKKNASLKKELKSTKEQLESLNKYIPLLQIKKKAWHILGKDTPANGKK